LRVAPIGRTNRPGKPQVQGSHGLRSRRVTRRARCALGCASRLTELGLTYLAHQVPVERDDRAQLEKATGQRSIAALVADEEIVEGEKAIRSYLDAHFTEPRSTERQRAKAA